MREYEVVIESYLGDDNRKRDHFRVEAGNATLACIRALREGRESGRLQKDIFTKVVEARVIHK